jgi:FkbM family methyltransferase
MGFAGNLICGLRRRIGEASRLRGAKDIVVTLYDSLIRYCDKFPFPCRGRVCEIGIKDPPVLCRVRLGYSDGSVVEDVFVRRIYGCVDPGRMGPVRQVVDLGANVGITMRLWAALFPEAKITAVEPDPQNMEICRLNAEPIKSRVTLVQACVAGQAGTVGLDRSGVACAFRMVQQTGSSGESIPAMTMPELLAKCPIAEMIDLLKCDIEGAEREIFADSGSWIGRVRHILIELHTPYTQEAFLDDLRRGGSLLKLVWSNGAEDYPVLFLSRRDEVGR